MKILLIDDEVELAEPLKVILEIQGHQVSTANSGESGLEKIEGENFDLVITDKKMGKVSGEDVIRFVEEQSLETPVFLLTGDTLENYPFKNQKSRFFKKPISSKQLIQIIEEL